jgi:hypothetical protein
VFERFTDRARRVVVLAQEEARRLNHNYIGTEHILLGMSHEGEGVAAKVLASMDVSLDDVRRQVHEIIGAGGTAPTGHIPFTPRAKSVLELSLREALQLGHNYIGTEHILLGLIREGQGVGAQVLTSLGADLDRVRQAVIQVLSGYSDADFAREESTVPGAGSSSTAVLTAETAGIRPARCGFCNITSPESGPLYTGTSGALICLTCVRSVTSASPSARSQEIAVLRARERGPIREPMPPRTEYPEPLQVLTARHEPVGPPPDDEAMARAAIEYAFTDPMEVAADGTLVNVEDGMALKQYADQVRARVGWFIAENENVIEFVKFIDATRAAVWTTTRSRNGPPPPAKVYHEGWAVLVDGRWKVSRETIRERWRQAGIVTPPPAPPGPGAASD